MVEKESGQIIKGPWKDLPKTHPKISEKEKERIRLRNLGDDLTEQVMVQMIHTLHENGFDVDDDQFLRDTGFVIECVKGLIYRDLGVEHPMLNFMDVVTKDVDTSKPGGAYEGESLDTEKLKRIEEVLDGYDDDDDPKVS